MIELINPPEVTLPAQAEYRPMSVRIQRIRERIARNGMDHVLADYDADGSTDKAVDRLLSDVSPDRHRIMDQYVGVPMGIRNAFFARPVEREFDGDE